jgi:hypothetical protein
MSAESQIAEPEETATARQWLCNHASVATNTQTQKRNFWRLGSLLGLCWGYVLGTEIDS